jgi:hypothetical protein
MPAFARALFALAALVGFTGCGFLVGTVASVVDAIPDLAGGGHATGGHHFDYGSFGAIAGAVLGVIMGIAVLLLTPRRSGATPGRR